MRYNRREKIFLERNFAVRKDNFTREILIETFCLLLKEKSVEKITIHEITQKAGYNRGTFYQHFKDIYDILDCVENILVSKVKENFQKKISRDDFEKTFFEAFTKIHRENEFYFDVLFSKNNKSHFVEKLITEVSPIFIETFHLPPNNLKSKYLTEIYFWTTISAMKNWIRDGRKISLEELSKFLRGILTGGVMTEINRLRES